MKTIIINLLLKFVTPETIATLLAKIICKLLQKASASKNWDVAKSVADQAQNWLALFNQCYEDESIDESDEARIAKAIANLTPVQNISEIIKA